MKTKLVTYEGQWLLSQCTHLPSWCLTLISRLLKYLSFLQKICRPVWAKGALLSKHPDLVYSVLPFLCLGLLLHFFTSLLLLRGWCFPASSSHWRHASNRIRDDLRTLPPVSCQGGGSSIRRDGSWKKLCERVSQPEAGQHEESFFLFSVLLKH